jgi:hypothetical protein
MSQEDFEAQEWWTVALIVASTLVMFLTMVAIILG